MEIVDRNNMMHIRINKRTGAVTLTRLETKPAEAQEVLRPLLPLETWEERQERFAEIRKARQS